MTSVLPSPRSTPTSQPLAVTHEPWAEPLTRPAMGTTIDRHERVALTNRYVEISGRPAIPVSGELHYSRVPRAEWEERLRLMRSGGVTVVAAYVIWNHHELEPGRPSFEGDLDVAAFVSLCAAVGLDVVMRIGPWCHAEARNGGFPDWIQDAPVAHRTDDPGYLALVEEWFAALGLELAPLCGPASNVIAIQLENELYDQPSHLATLKALARRHGMTAPVYTATAWGGAELPAGEVLPLFGGYGDGFWVDANHDWDTTFREHFFFSHTWDDPGIGADLRDHPGIGRRGETRRLPSASFPAATCELGGGMATAYHRRPLLDGRDIAAVAHNKIGNGSGWQGYYMYAGGVNPRPALQESHATGYPNDLPEFDYDFHAPIGAAGRLASSHAELRRQHAFLAAFGSAIAEMPSTLPEHLPAGVDDASTLRWALRSDGESGWVFVTWQQPHVALETYRGAQFAVTLDSGTTVFPHAPVDVPAGTIAHWPVNLELGGVRLDWATASPLTVLGGDHPTLVVVAEAGIPVELSAHGATVETDSDAAITSTAPGVFVIDASEVRRLELVQGEGRLAVLVVPATSTGLVWVLDATGERRLVLSDAPVHEDAAGALVARSSSVPAVQEYRVQAGRFEPVTFAVRAPGRDELVDASAPQQGEAPPANYGDRAGRASAPTREDVARYGTAWTITLPPRGHGMRTLEIEWAGDVARLELGGEVVADRFWDGTPWTIGLGGRDALGRRADDDGPVELTLRIVPLHPEASVHLPATAAARREATRDPLVALDSVRLVEAPAWREA
ncbi:beta-galactosidase [Agromyces albus]|uniref:beta-galactosidase n=1 Tax=Agromyces albus TaxID=205332 RepID=UPI0027834FB3|nr:beta-galactosidase [Agromyces albus]MDQ0576567.1 beta-galactosidase [Agromyces albus]